MAADGPTKLDPHALVAEFEAKYSPEEQAIFNNMARAQEPQQHLAGFAAAQLHRYKQYIQDVNRIEVTFRQAFIINPASLRTAQKNDSPRYSQDDNLKTPKL